MRECTLTVGWGYRLTSEPNSRGHRHPITRKSSACWGLSLPRSQSSCLFLPQHRFRLLSVGLSRCAEFPDQNRTPVLITAFLQAYDRERYREVPNLEGRLRQRSHTAGVLIEGEAGKQSIITDD